MLFPYTYVPHEMEKIQNFIDFIFTDIWCNAPLGLIFSADLFDSNDTYKDLMSYFGFSSKAPERGKKFYKDVKCIYELFSLLKPHNISQLKSWHVANNSIEEICGNPEAQNIILYKNLKSFYPDLGEELAQFYRGLYDNSLLGLVKVKELFKGMDNHNKAFFMQNEIGKCPFCGINDLKGIHHTRREAYDHYLPKYKYPFNSLNFKNLAPACNECNSAYKLSKDPVLKKIIKQEEAKKRKSFFPYSLVAYQIDISISLNSTDVDTLHPDDLAIVFEADSLTEEIETWKDVYGIDERYKAKCCSATDGKYWITQILDEWKEDGRLPQSFLNTLARHTETDPFADNNFLRKAFLNGCKDKGLF
jgi:hypothetical protein